MPMASPSAHCVSAARVAMLPMLADTRASTGSCSRLSAISSLLHAVSISPQPKARNAPVMKMFYSCSFVYKILIHCLHSGFYRA